MVDSALPIAAKTINAVSHRITTECRGNYSFPSWDWSIISENAKSLIRSLLKMKVKELLVEMRSLFFLVWATTQYIQF